MCIRDSGTTVPLSTVPVPVTGITNATALAANAFHSCAVLADGRVECWGGNNYGQLGNGTSLQSNVPVAVTGLTDATDLAVGYMHTCAIVGGGGAVCWGPVSYTHLDVYKRQCS